MSQQVVPECRTDAYVTMADYLEIAKEWTNEKRDSEIGQKALTTLEKLDAFLSQCDTSNEDDATSIMAARKSITSISVLLKKDNCDSIKKDRISLENVVFDTISLFAKRDVIASAELIFPKKA